MFQLTSRDKTLVLDQPKVMGILNVTPDSFSDGGRFVGFDAALRQAEAMVTAGASIIDIGGESTRPGAADVSLDEELSRVVPVIEALASRLDVWLSVDTSKAAVMTAAVEAGADLINDVRALQEDGALAAAADAGVPVCLMHMQGQPRTMQHDPQYDDVVADVSAFFEQRIEACLSAGIERQQLMLDPGFGFGKTMEHNFQLLGQLSRLAHFELPLLIGLSRKSMFDHLLSRAVDARLPASLAGALIAAQQGSHIIRVHDVEATADVLAILAATQRFANQ